MAAPKNKKTEQLHTDPSKDITKKQQDHALNWSMLFLALGIISLLGITHPFDIEIFESINKGLKYLLGKCHILCPILFFFFSGRMLLGIALGRLNASFVSFLLILFCLPGLVHHLRIEERQELVPWSLTHGGGFLGGVITLALRRTLGEDGTLAFLIVGLTIAFAIVFPWKMVFGSKKKKDDKYDAYLQQTRRRKAEENMRKAEESQRKTIAAEPKTVFKAEPKTVHKPVTTSTTMPKQDVYNDDEFSSFTDGIKKENTFKRILSFGNDGNDTYENIKEEIENDPVQIPEWEEDPRREVVMRPVINYGESKVTPSKASAKPAEEIISNPYHKDDVETEARPVIKPFVVPENTLAQDAKPVKEPIVLPVNMTEPEQAPVKEEEPEPERESERPAFVIHERKDEAELNNQAVDAVTAINEAAVAEQGSEVMKSAAPATTQAPVPTEPAKPVAPPKPKYMFPPYELLAAPKRKDAAAGKTEIMQQCATLEQTLADFKVRANVIAATRGPAVTQFELQPAPGVKVNSVVNLADDIALRLAAQGVRIEAPIPGKSAIGIEVPNLKTDPVTFREVVDSDMVRAQRGKITVGLGKDISGDIITADIAKMPHLLIAGSTGSGKSVCINTIICGILYKALPEEVKLILVDPKVVELSIYDGIPHLLTPVVTDPKKAASALHWAVAEMERRYKLFADNHVRNIEGFNKDKEGEDRLPFIVIIIDEMADLMVCVKADIETAVMRLAAKARAAGIHMILATQRPSVDVITGVLKNNIPSRIAFAVTSLIDSRTILDSAGAEKLLGKGDMLYSPYGSSKPVRVQGCFVSDEEVGAIVDFIKDQSLPVEYSEEVTSMELESDKKAAAAEEENESASAGPTDDPLFEKALMLVLDTGQASASMMQRRFSIGYNRAARLVDTMAELGVVGKSMGSKPREVIMSRQEAEERFLHNE